MANNTMHLFIYDRIEAETESAILLYIDFDDEKPIWLPKSQIELTREADEVMIPEWLAIEKELI